MKTIARVLLAAAGVLTSASCRDAVAPAVQRMAPMARSSHVIETGQQDPPPEAPPELQSLTDLTVTPDAGFTDNTTAFGQSVLNYNSTDAVATVDVDVTAGTASYGSAHATVSASDLLAGGKGMIANATRVFSRTCGNGPSVVINATAYGHVWNKYLLPVAPFSLIVWGDKQDTQTKGASRPQTVCPAPKAKATIAYGGASGQSVSITVPPGGSANVGLAGGESLPGQDGGAALTSYSWSANGSTFGSGVSTSYNATSSTTFTLAVADEDSHSASASVSVDISEQVLSCPDGITPIIGGCDGDGTGGPTQLGVSGSMADCDPNPEVPALPAQGGIYCYFTDWYQIQADGSRIYLGSDLDYCDVE